MKGRQGDVRTEKGRKKRAEEEGKAGERSDGSREKVKGGKRAREGKERHINGIKGRLMEGKGGRR